MICPINQDKDGHNWNCMQQNCAWWFQIGIKGECSIRHLARMTHPTQQEK